MEASGAPLEQDAAPTEAAAAAPEGNGVVIVVGIFDPNDIVSLLRRGEGDVRAGLGNRVDQRVVDGDGQVGFAGLEPGGLFFACGYHRGRYQEVRCVAQDPSSGITLFQPPIQPSPTQVGTGNVLVADDSGAPPSEDLEVGLPEGVESPLLVEGAPELPVDPPADPSGPAPIDPALTTPPVSDPAPAESDAPVPGPDPTASESSGTGDQAGGAIEAVSPPVEAVPAEAAAEAPAPAEDPAPAPETPVEEAPVAETPVDAPPVAEAPVLVVPPSDAPAEATKVEEAPAVDPVAPVDAPVDSAPAEAVDPAPPVDAAPVDAPPAPDAGPAVDPAVAPDAAPAPVEAPAAAETPIEAEAPAAEAAPEQTPLQQLVAQAEGLGVDGAAGSTDEAWLRQAITEKNVTPVA